MRSISAVRRSTSGIWGASFTENHSAQSGLRRLSLALTETSPAARTFPATWGRRQREPDCQIIHSRLRDAS